MEEEETNEKPVGYRNPLRTRVKLTKDEAMKPMAGSWSTHPGAVMAAGTREDFNRMAVAPKVSEDVFFAGAPRPSSSPRTRGHEAASDAVGQAHTVPSLTRAINNVRLDWQLWSGDTSRYPKAEKTPIGRADAAAGAEIKKSVASIGSDKVVLPDPAVMDRRNTVRQSFRNRFGASADTPMEAPSFSEEPMSSLGVEHQRAVAALGFMENKTKTIYNVMKEPPMGVDPHPTASKLVDRGMREHGPQAGPAKVTKMTPVQKRRMDEGDFPVVRRKKK